MFYQMFCQGLSKKNRNELEVVLDIRDLVVDREFDLELFQSTSSMLKELTGKVKPPDHEKRKIVETKHKESWVW